MARPKSRNIALALVGAACIIASVSVAARCRPIEAAIFVLAMAIFAFPGVLFTRMVLGCDRKDPAALLIGAVFGISVSSLAVASGVHLLGWGLPGFLSSLAAVYLSAFWIGKAGQRSHRLDLAGSSWERRDAVIAIAFVLLIVAFFILPFRDLGRVVGTQRRYTWLFGRDFIGRMAYTASVSQDIPPDHMWFAGAKMQYYYLSYVLPASVYRIAAPIPDLQEIGKLVCVSYALLMVPLLYAVFRRATTKRNTALLLMGLAFLFYSYVDFFVLARGLLPRLVTLPPNVYDFIASRSSFSQSLHRLFLVQPAGVMGISLMLAAIYLGTFEEGNSNKSLYWGFQGVLAGLALGVSAFSGLVIGAWFFGTRFLQIVRGRRSVSGFKCFVLSGVCAGLVTAVLFALGMYSLSGGASTVTLRLHKVFLIGGPAFFLFQFGPAAIFAVVGLIFLSKRRRSHESGGWEWVYLLLLGAFITVLVTSPVDPDMGIDKGSPIVFLALLLIAGWFFDRVSHTKRLKALAATAMILAFPTFITDIYTAANTNDRKNTTYIERGDYAACRWIKENTSPKAILQAYPEYPGFEPGHEGYHFSPITVFAERRIVVGPWVLSRVLHDQVGQADKRFVDMKEMFTTPNVTRAAEIADRYGLDYVYIGGLERKRYGSGIEKFRGSPSEFECVYDRDGVEIYRRNRFANR